jgi:hypothetical protein
MTGLGGDGGLYDHAHGARPVCGKCGRPVMLIGGTTVHREGADGIWCALLNPAPAAP